jgi:isocitrate/isopropylmalate dehydrogenase
MRAAATRTLACIRQHTSAYASIGRRISIRQHAGGSVTDVGLACVSIRQHASAYVSIRQHTPAYISIHQHTSAYASIRHIRQHTSAYASIRQHTSAYVSIRQHTSAHTLHASSCSSVSMSLSSGDSAHAANISIPANATRRGPVLSAYVSIRQHMSAYVSIRQHTSAYANISIPANATTRGPSEDADGSRVSIREHTLAYVSKTSASQQTQQEEGLQKVSTMQTALASAYVSIREHT